LELGQRARGGRPEDAVDSAAVEAQPAQPGLERDHVVATQVGRHELEVTIAEPPRGLDERQPRRLVTRAVVAQAAVTLERPNCRFRRLAVLTTAGRDEPRRPEAALEIAYGVAVLPAGQREETRNSSSSWSSWALPLAPTRRLCTSPPENTSSVGMLITL
jgi:hypothetical protein